MSQANVFGYRNNKRQRRALWLDTTGRPGSTRGPGWLNVLPSNTKPMSDWFAHPWGSCLIWVIDSLPLFRYPWWYSPLPPSLLYTAGVSPTNTLSVCQGQTGRNGLINKASCMKTDRFFHSLVRQWDWVGGYKNMTNTVYADINTGLLWTWIQR